jgi:predicted phosphodiesterase
VAKKIAAKAEPIAKSETAAKKPVAVENLDGVALVEHAITVLNTLPGRLPDSAGAPGGLVMFPDKIRPIIIGDLHANRENLSLILEHDANRADLESGKAACILLGDALHDDRTGHMTDMQSSVEILDDVLRLIVRYPGQIYYIRGNHDSFDERLRKSGIAQGLELKNLLVKEKGQEYMQAVQRFFDAMPLFIIGNSFVITHAGPPHGGIVRDELVNIKKYPEKMHQLMWNRVNEFHGNPSLKEYGEKDIRLALDMLDMPKDTEFIVGHNPIWTDGNKIGVWLHVIGIRNHHILYSGYGSAAPYITFIEGTMIVKTAEIKKPEVYYYG